MDESSAWLLAGLGLLLLAFLPFTEWWRTQREDWMRTRRLKKRFAFLRERRDDQW